MGLEKVFLFHTVSPTRTARVGETTLQMGDPAERKEDAAQPSWEHRAEMDNRNEL